MASHEKFGVLKTLIYALDAPDRVRAAMGGMWRGQTYPPRAVSHVAYALEAIDSYRRYIGFIPSLQAPERTDLTSLSLIFPRGAHLKLVIR
jgi:hypothetical protein